MLLVLACGTFDASGCDESVWVFLYTFLIPTLLAIGIGISIVSFLATAVSFVTSAGDTKGTEEAVEKLKGSAIGLALILLAYIIVQVIISSLSGGAIFSDISGSL
jgi:hypothetical protein